MIPCRMVGHRWFQVYVKTVNGGVEQGSECEVCATTRITREDGRNEYIYPPHFTPPDDVIVPEPTPEEMRQMRFELEVELAALKRDV